MPRDLATTADGKRRAIVVRVGRGVPPIGGHPPIARRGEEDGRQHHQRRGVGDIPFGRLPVSAQVAIADPSGSKRRILPPITPV